MGCKKIGLPHSVRESSLYGISVQNDTNEWPISFEVPCTCTMAAVQLYVPYHEKLLTLTIVEGPLYDEAILCLI